MEKATIIALTPERWVLEVYRMVIETLQGIAWMLLAYVVVRLSELKRGGVAVASVIKGTPDRMS